MEDFGGGISAQYWMLNRPGVTMVLHSPPSDETVQVMARWEDAAYSFNLVQRQYLSSDKFVVLDKSLNAQAESANGGHPNGPSRSSWFADIGGKMAQTQRRERSSHEDRAFPALASGNPVA